MEPHTNQRVAARPIWRRTIGGVVVAAVVAGAAGCQAPRSHESLDRIEQELAQLRSAWDEARLRAEGDEQAQARLNEIYLTDYLDLVHRAGEMRLNIIYEEWQDARAERRKARGLPPPPPPRD